VRGFNPQLRLDVNETRTNGGPHCDFVYHDVELDAVAGMDPPGDTVMPWRYHLGHLYKTIHDVVVESLGRQGEEAMSAALADFAAQYGQDAAQIIESYQNLDFDRLPE
jgi:hypothetical protein